MISSLFESSRIDASEFVWPLGGWVSQKKKLFRNNPEESEQHNSRQEVKSYFVRRAAPVAICGFVSVCLSADGGSADPIEKPGDGITKVK